VAVAYFNVLSRMALKKLREASSRDLNRILSECQWHSLNKSLNLIW
jgi:hypothetical protein